MAGVTRSHVPLTWESKRSREDYGDLTLDIVIEDTLVRTVGSSSNSVNWIGIVDLPDGQYRLEHGLVVTEDTRQAPAQEPAVTLVGMNGLEQRLKDEKLRQRDRQRIEAELKDFRAQVGNGVNIKPVTYRNPQSQENEPGADVFLEGTSEPLGWISQDHLPLVTGELTGVLVSGGGTRSKSSARRLSRAPRVNANHHRNMRSRIRYFSEFVSEKEICRT